MSGTAYACVCLVAPLRVRRALRARRLLLHQAIEGKSRPPLCSSRPFRGSLTGFRNRSVFVSIFNCRNYRFYTHADGNPTPPISCSDKRDMRHQGNAQRLGYNATREQGRSAPIAMPRWQRAASGTSASWRSHAHTSSTQHPSYRRRRIRTCWTTYGTASQQMCTCDAAVAPSAATSTR